MSGEAKNITIQMKDYGVTPEADSVSIRIARALEDLYVRYAFTDNHVTLKFQPGTYTFAPSESICRDYYISNHDQVVHHAVALAINGWQNLTIDGGGSLFLCKGRMLPMAITKSWDITIKNLSIDFLHPHISQVTIVANDENGMRFRPSEEVQWKIGKEGRFTAYGEGWESTYPSGIAFQGDTHHIVPQTSDLWCDMRGCIDQGNGEILAPNWKDDLLPAGTVVALRGWWRPAPAIVLDDNDRITFRNVNVHYAEGMGLVAQRCTDIHLNGFNVCLRKGTGRYFTTQADATHFVQCKGEIRVENGLYEGMMDDAINVHGVYLRVRERINDHTLLCNFEHEQAYGYDWGNVGDEVSFIRSATMDQLSGTNFIERIEKVSPKQFRITLKNAVPAEVDTLEGYGIENLTWTPSVIFRKCLVRNNRARGALFSSPKYTLCEKNVFDHTSGTAILLCGDCNGWYESGACRNLIIRKNKFINSLTNMFQFTNAVISIYPEIPHLEEAKTYFHGGNEGAILIEKNKFVTFDHPLIYAKSVDGLTIRNNKVTYNHDFEPFHWNQQSLLFEHCTRVNAQQFPEKGQ